MLSGNRGNLLLILLATVAGLSACLSSTKDSTHHSTKTQEASTETPETNTEAEHTKEDELKSFLKTNQAIISTISNKTPNTIMDCIVNEMIHKFRLPEQFYQIDDYNNTGKYIRLINPITNKKGIMILIRPTENMSKIELFDNGIKTISVAWRQMPEKCK